MLSSLGLGLNSAGGLLNSGGVRGSLGLGGLSSVCGLGGLGNGSAGGGLLVVGGSLLDIDALPVTGLVGPDILLGTLVLARGVLSSVVDDGDATVVGVEGSLLEIGVFCHVSNVLRMKEFV